MLLWGYLYWLGNLSGLLANSTAGALSAVLLILIFALWLVRRMDKGEVSSWLKEHWRVLAFQEIVFFSAFLMWAIVRGANPEIVGTEKPMELAFINGIYQSPSFPPNDPWLSGYAISYYYFGYLIVAALMHLLGTASGTAFNLAVALTFALTAATSSGLLINLLLQKAQDLSQNIDRKKLRRILLVSLLAPLFILIVSNGEGFLEMLHSRGIFWQDQADGVAVSGFWQWLDIQDLTQAPSQPLDWTPSRMGGTWWWRASRVLQDYTISGQSREVIDEFPFFFYLLRSAPARVGHALLQVALSRLFTSWFFHLPLGPMVIVYGLFQEPRSCGSWVDHRQSAFFLKPGTFRSIRLFSLAFIVPVFKLKAGQSTLGKFFSSRFLWRGLHLPVFSPFWRLIFAGRGVLPSLVFRTRAGISGDVSSRRSGYWRSSWDPKSARISHWRKWLNVFWRDDHLPVLFMLSLMIRRWQIGPRCCPAWELQ